MGIFDKLFGYKVENQKSIEIDFNRNGIIINGLNHQLPVKISILKEILGEPEEIPTETNLLYIWHDKGIRCFSKDKENVFEVDIKLMEVTQNQFFPREPFLGNLKIEGTDYKNYVKTSQNDYLFKEYKIGNSEIQVRLTKEEPKLIRSISIDVRENEKELLTNQEKYKFKKILGEKIEFKNFNFKLAIIEELMYSKDILKPKFDIYEFAEIKKIEGFSVSEGGYEPIIEVVEYFKALEIDKNLAKQVTEIYQDGGNEIYMNVTPQWDGEDDVFNIESFEDIKYFPNLKKMTLFEIDPKNLEELKLKGIDVETA